MVGVVDGCGQAAQVGLPRRRPRPRRRQVDRAHAPVVVADRRSRRRQLAIDLHHQAGQLLALAVLAAEAHDPAGRLEQAGAQRLERGLLGAELAHPGQLGRERGRVEPGERGRQVAVRRRSVQVGRGAGVAHRRATQVHAAVGRIEEAAVEGLVDPGQAVGERRRRRRRLDVRGQPGADLGPEGVGILEQEPARAIVERRGDVDPLGVGLAQLAGRVGRPHARRMGELRREHPVAGRIRGQGRDLPVGRIVEDRALALEHAALDREHVGDRAAGAQLAGGEGQRAIHGVVGGLQPVQGVDERVGAGERDRHQVGLQLHLARQRALGQHHPAEGGVDQRADRPDDRAQDPADPRHAQIDRRQHLERLVELVALDDDVAGDLLRGVDPAPDRHRALREVTELVGEHRLELAQREHVDEAEPDLQVLARRDDQVGEGQIVEDGGVDPGRDEDAVRPGGARLVGEAVQEGEQARVLVGGELVRALVAVLAAGRDHRLEHEHREEAGAGAAQAEEPPGVAGAGRRGEEPDRGPREPAGEGEVGDDEQRQAGDGQVGVSAVGGAGPGQLGRDVGGAAGVELVHD